MGSTPASIRSVLLPVSAGESPLTLYAATEAAQEVINFETFPEAEGMTLRTVNGPCTIEPDRGSGYEVLGEPHALIHAMLKDGTYDCTLLRAGTKIYRHVGWERGWIELESGLNDERRVRSPEQFLRIGDHVIWYNGIDRPRVFVPKNDGQIFVLGFHQAPAAPEVRGPISTGSNRGGVYENYDGYSVPGDIGTVGDVMNESNGWLLQAEWYCAIQFQSVTGDLSPLSPASSAIVVGQLLAQPWYTGRDPADYNCAELQELLRQFLIVSAPCTESNLAGVRFYRTPDALRNPKEFRYLDTVFCNDAVTYPDRTSDAGLGPPALDVMPMPIFKVACVHQGRLVIGNFADAEGDMAESEALNPGTILAQTRRRADSSGAALTGLASHAGRLLAFTETCIYDVTDRAASKPITRGIGLVAHKSLATLPSGDLMWLARGDFYALGPDGSQPRPVSANYGRYIQEKLSRSRMVLAAAAYNSQTGAYMCAVAEAGQTRNKTLLCFDGKQWQRQSLGISVADLCLTDDARQYMFAAGFHHEDAIEFTNIFALGREHNAYDPLERDAVYMSPWFRTDAMASESAYIRNLHIGLVDSSSGTATIEFFRNHGFAAETTQTFDLHGRDGEVGIEADWAGDAVIGEAKFRSGRLMWRTVPVDLHANTWCFRITCPYPARMHLVGFRYEITKPSSGSAMGRTPRAED